MSTPVYHRFTSGEPWAITESGASEWQSLFRYEAPSTLAAVDRDFFGNTKPQMQVVNGTAVIPIVGPMIRAASFLERGFGACSHGDIEAWIDAAESDPAVQNILFAVDSPGGSVSGTMELYACIASARKPTAAFTSGLMASAAYWSIASVKKIFATEGANVGSVGVLLSVVSLARALQSAGVDVSVYTSGPYKAAGHPATTLTDEQGAMFQARVDEVAEKFKSAITKHRRVQADSMQGQIFYAGQAKQCGLVDGIVSGLPAVLKMLSGTHRPASAPVAAVKLTAEQLIAAGNFVAAWNDHPEIRGEFGGDFESFQGYHRAIQSGRIKIHGPGRGQQ